MSKTASLVKALSLLSAAWLVLPATANALTSVPNGRAVAAPAEPAGLEQAAYLGAEACRHIWRGHRLGCCPPLGRGDLHGLYPHGRCLVPHGHVSHPIHERIGHAEHARLPHEHSGGGHRPFPRPGHHHHHHGHGEGGAMGGGGHAGGDRLIGSESRVPMGFDHASEAAPGARIGTGHHRYGGMRGTATGGFPGGGAYGGRPAMSNTPLSGRMSQPAMGNARTDAPSMGIGSMGAPHMGGAAIGAAPRPAVGGMHAGGMQMGAPGGAAPMATPAAAPQMSAPHMSAPTPAPAAAPTPAPTPSISAPAASAGHR